MFGKRGNDDGSRGRPEFRPPAPAAPPLRRPQRSRAPEVRPAPAAAGAGRPAGPQAGRSAADGRRAAQGAARAQRKLLRHQEPGVLRADRHDRPVAARQARPRQRTRGNPRHRQRHHRDQELRDDDRRAGGTARGHLQRRPRLWSARAAAGPRRHRRHHGQRLQERLHRGQRQGRADRHPLPRQPAAPEHLPAHRQPGRPPCRRIVTDLRRPPARRLARQRDRAAAGHRRHRAHHPQVQEGQADPRPAGQVRRDLAGRRRGAEDHRPRPLQRHHLGRHRFGQDDAAQLPDQLCRPRGARHHLRGLRRAAAAAAARGPSRNPPAQPRGRGRGDHARPGQELPAHAARAHHRRRGARTGGVRPPAGDEHRP